MLYIPNHGHSGLESSYTGTSSAEYGATVTAGGTATSPNVKHTVGDWAEVDAATPYDAWGVMVTISNIGTSASTNTRALVNIGIGAAGSEVTIIPNLICGQAGAWNSASIGPVIYYFPIFIPAGVRIAANMQSVIPGDTASVNTWLYQYRIPGKWYGSRVTAYGVVTSDSRGTSATHGQDAYGAWGTGSFIDLSSSTDNPIRYMQIGTDMWQDASGNTKRGLFRIAAGATNNFVAAQLPYRESTTLETPDFSHANFILSHMMFNIPAASYLGLNCMMNAAGEGRGWALYGVD